MTMTFRIEWSPEHRNNKVVQFAWPSREDVGYGPDCYDLDLTSDVGEWCSENLREFPDLLATDWVTVERQEYPSTIELTFDNEEDAILFRVRWLDRLKSG